MKLRRFTALLVAVVLAGCAQNPMPPESRAVANSVRDARAKRASAEGQAALCLQAAAEAAPRIGVGNQSTSARDAYNTAAANLAVLLRDTDGGRLWNRPLTLTTASGAYRLRYQPGNLRQGLWAPDFFTSFALARDVLGKAVKRRDRQDGVGGALVGVRKKTPREPFAPFVGVTAPVTATLDFRGHDATLALRDPSKKPKARVAGAARPLAADFSAPLAYYPSPNEMVLGLMGALRGGNYAAQSGLYLLQPYDPDRIPLIFVHGLISTARMWRNVANEIETDPALRGRFQCWVFNYPTGNPVLYSGLVFREELAKAQKLYGLPHGVVLVGHSMGGIVSRLQATTLDRAAWVRGMGAPAERLLSELPEDTLIHRAMIFDANPRVRRIVFICTPHRGSAMATGGIGALAMRLIVLPSALVSTMKTSVGNSLMAATGSRRLPNSIYSLSPKNPTLVVMDKAPIRAPHHTIFGDRGKGDAPNSSDGVVPYWSSHLESAASEKAVPGPHGSCELPETIAELKRILHEHLQTANR